ncbi:MAG: carbohydrate-binding domain-containing protein [Lachnospiraceae bacterium]|nr:carbohydrate-binding domain-containing protein [Lachnospiraceae bacterium]
MSTNKNIDKICAVVIVIALIVTVLFMNGEKIGITAIVDEDAETYEGNEYFTSNDLNGTWDTENATFITLTGSGADINGNGVYSYDGDVYISGGGKYVFTGSLDDGSIIVDAYESSKVYILFNGVSITCSDDAGFKVEQADKVFLTLADGTENSISCGETYCDAALEDNVSGAIHSHDDLTINGSGSLTVTAEYRHGIVSKDDLVITGGTISVKAKEDGIHVNDAVKLTGATINIDAEDDGIHSDLAFVITGGNLTIDNCYEGIEAVTIDIEGGDIKIYPTDDGLNANGGSGMMGGMGGPGGGMGGGPGGMGDHSMSGNSASGNTTGRRHQDQNMQGNSAGMESTGTGTTEGAPDRDVSAEGAQNTQSADKTQSAQNADDAQSADRTQSAQNADDTQKAASAKGTNSADNADSTDSAEDDEETYVHISGGTLTIINDSGRDADGIDSNGDLIISGGTIRVSLINNGNNSALDYGSESGGVAEISGGDLIASGNYSMAEHFDSSSTQVSLLYTFSEGAEAGTTVALEDQEGNVLQSYEVPQSFSSINFSCPELKVGETYAVIIGDNEEQVTIEEVSASYGDAKSEGFGGNHVGGGGMQPREMREQGRRGNGASENGMQGPPDMSGMSEKGMQGPPDMGGMSENGMQGPSDMGGMSENGMQGPPDMQNGGMQGMPMEGGASGSDETAVVDTATPLTEFEKETWIRLAISAIILIVAVAFAFIYKRRRH